MTHDLQRPGSPFCSLVHFERFGESCQSCGESSLSSTPPSCAACTLEWTLHCVTVRARGWCLLSVMRLQHQTQTQYRGMGLVCGTCQTSPAADQGFQSALSSLSCRALVSVQEERKQQKMAVC